MAARTKKTTEQPTAKPAPLPVGVIENSLHQKWIAPMEVKPPDQQPQQVIIQAPTPQPEETVSVVEEEPDFYEEEPENPFDELMAELVPGGEEIKCSVTELPNYATDRNGSVAHAETIYCGAFVIPSWVRSKDELIRLVQEYYALPGKPFYDFAISIRGRRLKRNLPVIRIKSIVPTYQQPAQQSEGNHAIPAAVVPIDPLDALKKQAEVFRELKKIFNDDKPRESQAIATVGNPLELTPESAMLKLLEVEPAKLEAVRSRIFGNSESSGGSEWVSLFREMMPILMPLFAGIAQKFMQPQAAPEQEQSQAAQLPQQPQAPVPPQEYFYLIRRVLEGIEKHINPELIAEEIHDAMQKDETLNQLLSGIVDSPIDLILSQLATVPPQIYPNAAKTAQQSNAKQWLTELQGCFGEEDTIESTQPNN